MKTRLVYFFIMLYSFVSCQSDGFDELSKKSPFTMLERDNGGGVAKEYYNNGKLLEGKYEFNLGEELNQINFKNGVVHGEWIKMIGVDTTEVEEYINGDLVSIRSYEIKKHRDQSLYFSKVNISQKDSAFLYSFSTYIETREDLYLRDYQLDSQIDYFFSSSIQEIANLKDDSFNIDSMYGESSLNYSTILSQHTLNSSGDKLLIAFVKKKLNYSITSFEVQFSIDDISPVQNTVITSFLENLNRSNFSALSNKFSNKKPYSGEHFWRNTTQSIGEISLGKSPNILLLKRLPNGFYLMEFSMLNLQGRGFVCSISSKDFNFDKFEHITFRDQDTVYDNVIFVEAN